MKKHALLFLLSPLFVAFLLTGCVNNNLPGPGPAATGTPTITTTPDPCSPAIIGASIDKVHKHMREFDDAANLAASIPPSQISALSSAIGNLQTIRRAAEDEPIPPCLANLKTYQVTQMNTVITTLLEFMNGGDPKIFLQGVALARRQHDQYVLELARLLGITPVPVTSVQPATATAQATSTP